MIGVAVATTVCKVEDGAFQPRYSRGLIWNNASTPPEPACETILSRTFLDEGRAQRHRPTVASRRKPKRKMTFTADAATLDRVEQLVSRGEVRSVSEFIRMAVLEKLDGLARDRLAEEIEAYCAAGHAREDTELIAWQSIQEESTPEDTKEAGTEHASG